MTLDAYLKITAWFDQYEPTATSVGPNMLLVLLIKFIGSKAIKIECHVININTFNQIGIKNVSFGITNDMHLTP